MVLFPVNIKSNYRYFNSSLHAVLCVGKCVNMHNLYCMHAYAVTIYTNLHNHSTSRTYDLTYLHHCFRNRLLS